MKLTEARDLAKLVIFNNLNPITGGLKGLNFLLETSLQ